MANYVIKTETGNMPIPKISDIVESDCYSVHTDEITGTVSDPYPIWQKDNMFVKWYKTGSTAYIRYKKSDNTEQSATTLGYTSICAYYTESIPGDETTKVLNIGFVANFTMTNNVTSLRNGNATLLYHGSFADAIASGLISDLDGWKEKTDPNYDPNTPQGGENADIEPPYSEDVDDGFLTPFDPYLTETAQDHTACRMMQPYLMSDFQYKVFGEIMWEDASSSSSFWHSLFQNVLNGTIDPMNCIGGVTRLPISPGNISTFETSIVYLGGVKMEGVFASCIHQRYVRMRFGLRLKEAFGTYFDYTNTQIQLYLPYINTVDIDASEVMDSSLRVTYIIDILTGDLMATLNCQKSAYGRNLNSIIGRWKGNCAMGEIYSRANTQQHAQNIVNGAFGITGSLLSGNVLGAMNTGINMAMDQRIKTEKGGGISGNSGWYDIQAPYLIIKRNVPLYPDNFMEIEGAEQNATFTVSALSGFTKFDSIHVELANASDEENAEIESYLKNGIIL